MAQRVKLKFDDGHTEVHFVGVLGADYTLCGHDTDGDREWSRGEPTKKKVDCSQCIAVVEYCKKHITKAEYSSGHDA